MATIEYDSSDTFFKIIEEMDGLTRDISEMLEGKKIDPEAAKWLLSKIQFVAEICRDGMTMNEESSRGNGTLSF